MAKTTLLDELSANLSAGGIEALQVAMKYQPLKRAVEHWDSLTSEQQDQVADAVGISAPFPAADKGKSIGLDEYIWDAYDRATDIESALQWIEE